MCVYLDDASDFEELHTFFIERMSLVNKSRAETKDQFVLRNKMTSLFFALIVNKI